MKTTGPVARCMAYGSTGGTASELRPGELQHLRETEELTARLNEAYDMGLTRRDVSRMVESIWEVNNHAAG